MKKISKITFAIKLSVFGITSVLSAQWQLDVRLTFNDSISHVNYSNAKCVATWARGAVHDVHVVWSDNRTGDYNIYYKRSTDSGLNWDPDIQLTFYQGDRRASYAAVDVLDSIVHVVYKYRHYNADTIYYKRSTDYGVTWGSSTALSEFTDYLEAPAISVSGPYVHVVWDEYSGVQDYVLYCRSTDSGTTWGPRILLESHSETSRFPSISSSGNYVHVVWEDYRNGNFDIYYKRSSNNGLTWEPEIRLTVNDSIQSRSSISACGGYVHVLWQDRRDNERAIYRRFSSDNGASWSPDIAFIGNPAVPIYPDVCLSNNNVHVVWLDTRYTHRELYYRRSADQGNNWEPETRLTNVDAWKEEASVTTCDYCVHVVWDDRRDGSNPEIYYKRDPSGNAIAEEVEHRSIIVQYTAAPNPFVHYTTITNHTDEIFVLYDVAGRRIGSYLGNCIGFNLNNGVYFLKPKNMSGKYLPVVKVR